MAGLAHAQHLQQHVHQQRRRLLHSHLQHESARRFRRIG
jgi:hypothetical protein